MIKKIDFEDLKLILKYSLKDIARNYFICVGLLDAKKTYKEIYVFLDKDRIEGLFLLRQSGTSQLIYTGNKEKQEYIDFIQKNIQNKLITTRYYMNNVGITGLFREEKDDAYIAEKQNNILYEKFKYNFMELKEKNLDEVLNIYSNCFDHYAKKEQIKLEILNNFTRIYGIKSNNLVSIIRTNCETNNSALIVGLATTKKFRNQGYGTECLKNLCNILNKENKKIFLQYNNLEAGRLYSKLGFINIDRVCHIKK